MPANNSQLKALQKELSKNCAPVSYRQADTIENRKTLGDFWQEVLQFAEENGMTIEDANEGYYFTDNQQIAIHWGKSITFNGGITAVVAQFNVAVESGKEFRESVPERIWFHLNGARWHFGDTNSWALMLTNVEDFKAVHTCDYQSLKNVLGEAVIALPFNKQRIMPGNHEDVSMLVAYSDMPSMAYRNYVMGELLPLVKESLLTIQKFIFICKKIEREREIQEVGNHYVS